MQNAEQKTCPRCSKSFPCSQKAVNQCECYGVVIGPELGAYLKLKYKDCVCATCLCELKREVAGKRG